MATKKNVKIKIQEDVAVLQTQGGVAGNPWLTLVTVTASKVVIDSTAEFTVIATVAKKNAGSISPTSTISGSSGVTLGSLAGPSATRHANRRIAFGSVAAFVWEQFTDAAGNMILRCKSTPKPAPVTAPPSTTRATFPPSPFLHSHGPMSVTVALTSKALSATYATPWLHPDKPSSSGSWSSVSFTGESLLAVFAQADYQGRRVIAADLVIPNQVSGFSADKQYKAVFVYGGKSVTMYSHSGYSSSGRDGTVLTLGLPGDDWTSIGTDSLSF